MGRIDDYLIDVFDACAAWAQHRGANLLYVKMVLGVVLMAAVVEQAVLAPTSLAMRTLFAVLDGVVFGATAYVRYQEWVKSRDYVDVVRKTDFLNRQAMGRRESYGVRMFITSYELFVLVDSWARVFVDHSTVAQAVAQTVVAVTWVSLLYLDCALYLGPGDRSRQKRESWSGRLAESRSS